MTKEKPIDDFLIAKKYRRKVQNARERGIKFELSLLSFYNLFKRTHCPFSGKLLTADNASIDRIDNRKGYVKGNVILCDRVFNTRKGDLTFEEMQIILEVAKKRKLI